MCARKKSIIQKNIQFSDEFYSDLTLDGMIYASLVRTPISKGRIHGIDTKNLSSGCRYIDSSDIPKRKYVLINGTPITIFCGRDIDFKGQAVAIITAQTQKQAVAGAESIVINGDEDFYYDDDDENNILANRSVEYGEEAERKDDDMEVEETWESELTSPSFQEANGALCMCRDDGLYVWTPSQWTRDLRENLSSVTGISEDKIFITRTKVLSKHSNLIFINTLLVCQCAIAAIASKKPVMLELSREEQKLFAEHSSLVKINHKTLVNKDGILKSMDINIHVNAGSYNPFATEIADRLTIASIGLYRCPSIHINTSIYKSHSVPSSIDFAVIEGKAFFAIENQINKIAQLTGIDPVELRQKNMCPPKTQRPPFFIETDKAQGALDAICRKSIFLRKYAANKVESKYKFAQDNNSPFAPPLRGIGIATGYEGSGYLGSSFINRNMTMEITLTKDKKLLIHALPPSQNIWKIWQDIASRTTGIAKEDIILDSEFLNTTEPDSPQTTSATITITTQLIQKACAALNRKKESKLPVTIKKSFTVNSKKGWKKDSFTGYPFVSTAFAAMVVELELDGSTLQDKIRGVSFIIDAGKILNPRAAEISIKKSIQNVLSLLVENNTLETDSISIQFMQSDAEPRQIGEVVLSLLPAAYTSALSQAVGKTITELPIQTDTAFNLISEAKEESSK